MDPVPLLDLLEPWTTGSAVKNTPIRGLCSDHRQVQEGDLFVALPGQCYHGLQFWPAARAAGAQAVLWEPTDGLTAPAPDLGPNVALPSLSQRLPALAQRFYGGLLPRTLIGITGTDGKTSCAHLLAQALDDHPERCGYVGTLGVGLPGHYRTTGLTTPDLLGLYRGLADLGSQGAQTAALEVSSHALHQQRVAGLSFAVAVLTNLGRDHLDYHGDLANYRAAKARLFSDCQPQRVVLNTDDTFGRSLATELPATTAAVGYGFNPAVLSTVLAHQLTLSADGLAMTISSAWGNGQLRSPLLGRFNAYNLLAVLATLLILEIPFQEALACIQQLTSVPGRMERVAGRDNQPTVIVDYAHTPQALEQALAALREHHPCRLWCVFGCGGDRDRGKRPTMGAAAERGADHWIVTNDNPRSETPDVIATDILAGMACPEHGQVILDREQAIHAALAAAAAEDIVLIAGKGHEDYQLIGDQRRDFSDRDVVRHWLENSA